jgi:shikimate dehydrogenase
MDRYAVIGHPVEHSRSPLIHRLFAEQTGQHLAYEKRLAPLDDFAGTVTRLQAEGLRGANVTLPFKFEALRLCDVASERARRAGAVNTLSFEPDGQRRGDNTDGTGLVRDLVQNHALRIEGLRVLLLGAGGAVHGVLGPLLDSLPAAVTVANRTPARAQELVSDYATIAPMGEPELLSACGYDELEGRDFELIINGTSAGLAGTTPVLPDDVLVPGGCCYDMLYADGPTPFLRWAAAHGAGIMADGLGMLVEQAAESFFLWRGVHPDTLPVLRALRQSS